MRREEFPTLITEYDQTHWEELMGTVINRMGADAALEAFAYALSQCAGQEADSTRAARLSWLASNIEDLVELAPPLDA